jgi:hypothetical protein
MDVVYTLSAEGLGTLLEFDSSLPLNGWFFRLMGPIIAAAAAGNAKRDLVRLSLLAPSVQH